MSQDAKITQRNKKLKIAYAAKNKSEMRLHRVQAHHFQHGASGTIEKATRSYNKARAALEKAVAESLSSMGTGTGKIAVALPTKVYTEQIMRRRQV
jgi:glutamine amidotransferase PdxT